MTKGQNAGIHTQKSKIILRLIKFLYSDIGIYIVNILRKIIKDTTNTARCAPHRNSQRWSVKNETLRQQN